MDSLSCVLVPSSAAFLQQATQFLVKTTPSINSKGIRSIQRALSCPGVDKQSLLDTITHQSSVWAVGPTGSSEQRTGLATQNVLAMLSTRDVVARESRDNLLGGGCLSDPFILSGVYEVLLRTPVMVPTSQEFAFASTASDAANIYKTLISGTGSSSQAKPKTRGKKKNCSISPYFFGISGDPISQDLSHVVDRLMPLLDDSKRKASGTEFSKVIEKSEGGFMLDQKLAKSVEDLRGRLWNSMMKRGEMMIGMYAGSSGDSPNLRGKSTDLLTGNSSGDTDGFDFSDPEVLPHIWRMIASCQQPDAIDALLRRFPMIGNYLFHPPINTSGVGGVGVGHLSNQQMSSKAHARIFLSILESPCKNEIIERMDFGYLESVLISSIEDNPREATREWATEGLLVLNRLKPLSQKTISRLISLLSSRPLVSIGIIDSAAFFGNVRDIIMDPRLDGLLPVLSSQLCDTFWNQVRIGNCSSILAGYHDLIRSEHSVLKKNQTLNEDIAKLKKSVRDIIFNNFSSRLVLDSACERNFENQATFFSIASVLGHKEAVSVSGEALKKIYAQQQAQYTSLVSHVNETRESLVAGPSRNALKAMSVNPQASRMSRELLSRLGGDFDGSCGKNVPDEGLASDVAFIQSYKLRPRLTPNGIIGGLAEASTALGEAAIPPGTVSTGIQPKAVGDGPVPTYPVHVLGPRDTSDCQIGHAEHYIQKSGSARLLTTLSLHPTLSRSHGWEPHVSEALVNYMGVKVGGESHNTAFQAGFTVPLCRSLITHYVYSETFRKSLAESGCKGVSKNTHEKVYPYQSLFLGAENSDIPIIMGEADPFMMSLCDCARNNRRSVQHEQEYY